MDFVKFAEKRVAQLVYMLGHGEGGGGHAVALMVESLYYRPEGHRFECR
jgi:hypothetical protein